MSITNWIGLTGAPSSGISTTLGHLIRVPVFSNNKEESVNDRGEYIIDHLGGEK